MVVYYYLVMIPRTLPCCWWCDDDSAFPILSSLLRVSQSLNDARCSWHFTKISMTYLLLDWEWHLPTLNYISTLKNFGLRETRSEKCCQLTWNVLLTLCRSSITRSHRRDGTESSCNFSNCIYKRWLVPAFDTFLTYPNNGLHYRLIYEILHRFVLETL